MAEGNYRKQTTYENHLQKVRFDDVGKVVEQQCYKCNIWKNMSEYDGRDPKLTFSNTGKRTICKKCIKKQGIQRRYNVPDNIADLFSYTTLLKCIICKTTENLCIDHCHITNKYRGILCSRCNAVLGLMEESPHLLNNMAKYATYCERFREENS